MADRRCLRRIEILKKVKTLDYLSLYSRLLLPLAGRNPPKLKALEFTSLYGGPSLPLAVRNQPKQLHRSSSIRQQPRSSNSR